ncbi:MAG: glycosyltransferase [Acidobacteriota bacterium]
MKIAVVTDYFPTQEHKWQGQSAYQTLRVLAKHCDVHVFCPVAEYPRLLKPRSRTAKPGLEWTPGGVEVSYIRYPTLPLIGRGFNGFAIAWKLLEPVRAFQPDVILNYTVYPAGFAAVRIGRKLDVPVVLTSIGSDLNRLGDSLVARWKKVALQQADGMMTVSHDLAKTAVRLGADPAKTRAVLNGCDRDVFHPRDKAEARRALGLAADEEVVLYVGRLDFRKGLVELVEAAAALKEKRPRMRTYLIGSAEHEGVLRQAMAKHGVEQDVVIVAPCSSEQVGVWMGAADVVTLPSYNEGCPNVVVEAVNAGRPVVATRVGGIPELMDDSLGRLIPARDAGALAQALDEVLGAEWDAEAISESRRRSWADVADEVEELLRDAVARH